MTYRVSKYSALSTNLAAANTAVLLCRANIIRIPMNAEQRQDIERRVRLQIVELEAILMELGERRGNLREVGRPKDSQVTVDQQSTPATPTDQC